jgi:Flp pilus assembly protein CpaB
MAGSGGSALGKLFSGRRAGTTLMLVGLALAVLAATQVIRMSERAQAEAAKSTQPVYVVMATQDIPSSAPIASSAVAVKAFPASFVPPGAATRVEDVTGKFSTTQITRDQIVLSSQVSNARRVDTPSAGVPAGKVAFWMPVPDLLAQSGGLQAGDKVDILLTIGLTRVTTPGGQAQGGQGDQGQPPTTRNVTTQSTIQNAEVLFIGPAVNDQGQVTQAGVAKPGQKIMAVLLDPQDAVISKFIKDTGGTVDLVLRARDWQDRVETEAVTADSLVDRFRFRVPDRWAVSTTPK